MSKRKKRRKKKRRKGKGEEEEKEFRVKNEFGQCTREQQQWYCRLGLGMTVRVAAGTIGEEKE